MSIKISNNKKVVEFNKNFSLKDKEKSSDEILIKIIKAITTLHSEADKRLSELSQLCERKVE